MRPHLFVAFALAACSNAADPAVDAPPHGDDAIAADAADPDAPVGLRILVLNEVAAGENPDWFEIVNATTSPVQLSDFMFVDKAGDFASAVPFPAMTLGPGAFYAQDCDGTVVPIKLGSDEELWIYRRSDQALSDGVDWPDGASPTGSSYARIPDTFAPFQTTTNLTKGKPNSF